MVSETPRRNVPWPFNPRAIRPRPDRKYRRLYRSLAIVEAYVQVCFAIVLGAFILLLAFLAGASGA